MEGRSNYRRLSAKEQVIRIEMAKLEKFLRKGLAYKAIVYSFSFN